VSVVSTVRGFVLDIIAPKTKDIYYLCDYNNEYNKDSYIKGNNNNHSSHNVFNLVKYPHLTFAHVGVYILYILYGNKVKKDNDREEQSIENILNLYEKKFTKNK
jgi:hypothetical protein